MAFTKRDIQRLTMCVNKKLSTIYMVLGSAMPEGLVIGDLENQRPCVAYVPLICI